MATTAPKDNDLRERVIWVINEFVGTWRKYQYLEDRTGIAARKWQNVCNRVQQPSFEMVAALAENRPQFLSWMILGQAEPSTQVDPSIDGWAAILEDEQSRRINEMGQFLALGSDD